MPTLSGCYKTFIKNHNLCISIILRAPEERPGAPPPSPQGGGSIDHV